MIKFDTIARTPGGRVGRATCHSPVTGQPFGARARDTEVLMSGTIDGRPATRRTAVSRQLPPGFVLTLLALAGAFLLAAAPARAADPADDQWSGQFGVSGIDGTVECAIVDGTDLIVGGLFTSAGNVPAHNVARWDGANWHALGSGAGEGLDGTVYTLAVYGGSLYAGGYFSSTSGGGPLLRSVARFDGTNWGAVGGGTNSGSAVFAMTLYAGNLVVGGSFSEVGSPPQLEDNVAAWNGSAWVSVAGGLDKIVRALTVYNGDLIAGGYFVDRLVRFDGSTWSRVGDGFDPVGGIEALLVFNNILYVGGSFYGVNGGGTPAANVTAWNGVTFAALGAGCGAAGVDTVYALSSFAGKLIIGGNFQGPGAGLAQWNGSGFTPMAGGVVGTVKALANAPARLYAGGQFHESSVAARNLVGWINAPPSFVRVNPTQGVDDLVTHLGTWNNRLVVGGTFVYADGLKADGIALFDAASMAQLGTGLVGNLGARPVVYGSTPFGADLVIGGAFSQAGSVPAANVARWNGAAWSALGVGFDDRVAALTLYASEVVAGGTFTHALDFNTAVNHLARWDGTRWQPIGGGVSGAGEAINALAVFGGNLIVAGSFTAAGAVPANRIARWNGTTWSALGSGLNGSVTSLAVLGGQLFVGGFFTTAGGQPIANLARWDGASWSSADTGLNNPVLSLTATATSVYAGGYFSTAGGAAAANVAQWNGSAWSRMGSGTDGDVQALAWYKDGIYAGGLFRHAGLKSSEHLARWSLGATGVGEAGPAPEAFALSPAWPNPFAAATTVRFTLREAGSVRLTVFDAAGRLVSPPRQVTRAAGPQTLEWDGRDADGAPVGPGIYFLRVETPSGSATRKVIARR